jgi:hypothetical protein
MGMGWTEPLRGGTKDRTRYVSMKLIGQIIESHVSRVMHW